jgi:hypothetical protein
MNAATYIEVRYEDGSIDCAVGAAADHIMAWYRSCEIIQALAQPSALTQLYYTHCPPSS